MTLEVNNTPLQCLQTQKKNWYKNKGKENKKRQIMRRKENVSGQ